MNDGKLYCWIWLPATHLLRSSSPDARRAREHTLHLHRRLKSAWAQRTRDAAADAALIAKPRAYGAGQWMRADEHGWDPKVRDIARTIAPDRRQRQCRRLNPKSSSRTHRDHQVALVAAELAALPTDTSHPETFSGAGDSLHVPQHQGHSPSARETPFRPSWIRTQAACRTLRERDLLLDELARGWRRPDRISYPLSHDARRRAAATPVASRPLAAGEPPRRAVATSSRPRRRLRQTTGAHPVGVVADVEVNKASGQIRVTRFTSARLARSSTDGLRNQIEGNVIQTVSRTLIEISVRSLDRDQPRLGKLSDPHFPRRSRRRSSSSTVEGETWAPASNRGGRTSGDLQRGLRRYRTTPALGAVRAAESARGAEAA